jgi:formylglycine-generating enzyme required for sulfatase activity
MKSALFLALLAVTAPALGGDTFRDCPACPEMVALPAGAFQMGEAGRRNALPVHPVNLAAFAIGKYEVTQGEWKALMGVNPSKNPECGDACPVENVSWNDAGEFLRRLAAKTGQPYRLPSEAEWEYACRAGAVEDYCGSNDPDRVLWWGDEYGSTQPVGKKQANAWGLFDMSGNVWEWVADCSHPDYRGAPGDGSAWVEAGCASRILRGGSWMDGPQYARAALRFGFKADFRAGDIGLRVARGK